ncbi:MAG TPA: DUF1080 domain-containing protein [Bacteroidales bacterium]|nr:DUF1080 domain-containing protein [Bacteroidales bacterium]
MKNIKSIAHCIRYSLKLSLITASLLTLSLGVKAQADKQPIIGHWDLTVTRGNEVVPSWLEVKLSGFKTLVGHFVSSEGSARPIAVVNVDGNKANFSIPPQWEMGMKDLVFEGTVENDKLTGTITYPDGRQGTFTGVRAPFMAWEKEPAWGEPIKIFNGKNLDGWKTQKPENQWVIENGVLKSPKSGSNILTTQNFKDFKLHIEFRIPQGSNSGIYLRGRYELQIIDSKGQEPSSILFAGIYGFVSPNQDAALPAGEWQTYDITLIGRRVTIVANGKKTITDAIIPGITGGAIDSNEGEPGPILLQGDHGPVEFRNIVITPAK